MITPTTPSSVNNKKIRRNLQIVIGIILLSLVALALYFMSRPSDGRADQAVTNTNDSRAIKTADSSSLLTATLPNGKTATYANTEGNNNITWSSSDKGSDYLALSHKKIEKFISAADAGTITKLCGANGELAQKENIVVGVMSMSVRSIEYPTEENCLDELATLRNTNVDSRSEAKDLLRQVDAEIKEFYSKVIIE